MKPGLAGGMTLSHCPTLVEPEAGRRQHEARVDPVVACGEAENNSRPSPHSISVPTTPLPERSISVEGDVMSEAIGVRRSKSGFYCSRILAARASGLGLALAKSVKDSLQVTLGYSAAVVCHGDDQPARF